ncbi:MAG: DUF4288 domain-containing protein [Lysobacteraceae bacterium]
MTSSTPPAQERYAAKLLFQFRVTVDGDDGVMRTCEERIVVLRATHARDALARARRHGRKAQHAYRNDDGNPVRFEFVGVLDLLHLGAECDEDEVWYDIVTRKQPMARAAAILPDESSLCAIRNEAGQP